MFLNAFGLGFANTGWNGVYGITPIDATPHPIFENVTQLYQRDGHDIVDLDESDPAGVFIATLNGKGQYAVYDSAFDVNQTGTGYVYQVEAYDPDFDTLTYSLSEAPEGMWINANDGMIQWAPSRRQQGEHNVTVEVSDGRGGVATQSFVVTVIDETNTAPVIVSEPITEFVLATDDAVNNTITLETTVRDFNDSHADFESYQGMFGGMVESRIGADGKPILSSAHPCITSEETFDQWFRDVEGVNVSCSFPLILTETGNNSGIYEFSSDQFFPIDGQLLGNEGRTHNYHFTLECHSAFTYRGGEVFSFIGDDDVWVYINDSLVVDLGGVHSPASGMVEIDSLGLTIGETYNFDLFFAERHTTDSSFKIQTSLDLRSDLYTYDCEAVDADNDIIAYSLLEAPENMRIDSETGLIQWLPGLTDIGEHTIKVQASDGRGGYDTQTYVLNVRESVTTTVKGTVYNDANQNGRRDSTMISGDDPLVVFVVDTSGSMGSGYDYSGDHVGDLNGSGQDTRIDAVIYAMEQYRQRLVDMGMGDSADLALIDFSGTVRLNDMNPSMNGLQLTVSPNSDADNNGVSDFLQAAYLLNAERGDGTNYSVALRQAVALIQENDELDRETLVVFISDGCPNSEGTGAAYADQLRSLGASVYAFGVGSGSEASLQGLQYVDSNAVWFDNMNDLYDVFAGLNGDVVQYDEAGLSGWDVYLDVNENGVYDSGEPTTTTDADGVYELTGVPVGDYTLRVVEKDGWTRSQPASESGYRIVTSASETVRGKDFGFYQNDGTSSISGYVVDDANRNGVQDEGEGYLSNQVVWLDQNQNDKLDAGERRTLTDANGYYCFSNLASGTYYVRYRVDDDYVQTFPTDGEWSVGENLILNGDFEDVLQFSGEAYECYVGSTAIANWNVVAGSVSIHAPIHHQMYDGLYCIDLQGDGEGAMTQTISTVPGTRYVVQYAIAGNTHGEPTVKRYTISNGMETFFGTYDITNTTAEDMGWEVRTWSFVATDYETTLTFAGLDSTLYGACIDDVFVAPTTQAVAGGYTVVLGSSQTAKDRNFGAYKQDVHTPTLNIVSVAPTSATVGEVYRYSVQAVDSEGEKLTWSLLAAPDGMMIVPESGIVVWTPKDADVGACQVVVSVKNESGLTDAQTFSIDVSDVNHCPILFTDSFPTPAFAGSEYVLQIEASDPDGDELTYTFDAQYNGTAPEGMTIDAKSGKITWTPTLEQLGEHTFTFAVVDDCGAYVWATGVLKVAQRKEVVDVEPESEETDDNAAPILLTSKIPGAYVGVDYDLTIEACDPDGDAFAFSFDPQYGGVAPEGMTIDAETGKIFWTPTSEQVGAQTFTVVVLDERGAWVTGSATITVVENVEPEPDLNEAPQFLSSPSEYALPSVEYVYYPQVYDPNGDVVVVSLIDAPEGAAYDAESGKFSWTPGDDMAGKTVSVTIKAEDPSGSYVTRTWEIDVYSSYVNQAPSITSTPGVSVVLGETYAYDVVATDPENDALIYSLENAPEGMVVDALTGKVRWTPTNAELGYNAVSILVSDAAGNTVRQRFNVYVGTYNLPPQITSSALGGVYAGDTYVYAVAATDPEEQPLSYQLGDAPDGMTIDSTTGQVRWTTTFADVGEHTFAVIVSDGVNQVGVAYNIVVVEKATQDESGNRYPIIKSEPWQYGEVGVEYQYDVVAEDPDGDELTYSLSEAPDGATIDPTTGALRWTPTEAQIGVSNFVVVVTDSKGLAVQQEFNFLTREKNTAPVITSTPGAFVYTRSLYSYDVSAYDPDGDAIFYAIENGPEGAIIDSNGRFRWTADATLGERSITISATDSRGNKQTQTWTLNVEKQGPTIQIVADEESYPVGKGFTFRVLLDSRVGIESAEVKLTKLDGSVVKSLTIKRNATVTANVPQHGEYLIQVKATDVDGFSSNGEKKILCSGVDPSAPVANITSPNVKNNEEIENNEEILIQKVTSIEGEIYDPDDDLEYYTISIGEQGLNPKQEDGWRVLYREDKDPNSDGMFERTGDNKFSYSFDPSTFADGWYTIRVEGYDSRGNKGGDTIEVFVLADSDWANFSFAFTDLNAQTSSIPYVMTRGYDTRLCDQDGDFGYGWTHTFRDLSIQTNVKSPDADWGVYEPFSYGSSKITVTLPDGSKDVFKFKLGNGTDSTDYYTSTAYNLMGVYSPSFECATDSGASLTVDGSSQFQLNKLRILDSGDCYTWNGAYAYNPFNPALNSGFTYTTKEGLAYHIDAQTMKVDSITDTCGNRLVFKGNEILDENGASVVTITRDSHSRITAITLADGRSVNYTYDANGNLSTFTGLDRQTITYCYFDTVKGKEHYIRSILDAEGNEALSLQYDDLGRVIGLADVTGAGINVSYDTTDQFVRTTTDQLGNTTVETLDDYGNVIKTVTPEGGVTTATYDDCGNKLTETTVVYNADGSVFTELTTSSTYDSRGNVASDTDVYGNVTTYTYDKFGQIASTTTNGITTSTKYDSKTGAPVSDTDKYGNVTLYEVGDKGTITSMTNENGELLFENTVDASGHVIKSESASGNTIYYSYDSHGNQVESWY